MRRMLKRLAIEDESQDLVEYALLVAFIALTSIAAWLAIQNALETGYGNWDTNEQTLSSTTPDPE